MAARTGRARDVAGLLADLEAERETILSPAATSATIGLDRETLRRLIEPHVLEMRTALLGSPELARTAFRALLVGRRMRVGPDPEQHFRVEGLFELELETADARAAQDSGRLHFEVAGGRSVTGEPLREAALRWAA